MEYQKSMQAVFRPDTGISNQPIVGVDLMRVFQQAL
jgi:hypothetical protein